MHICIVIKTAKNAKRLPNTFRYLLAYFIFSDGYNTVGSVGVLFGTEELDISDTGLIILAVTVPIAALIGWHESKEKCVVFFLTMD